MSRLHTPRSPLADRPALRVVSPPAPLRGPHSVPLAIDGIPYRIVGPTTAPPPDGVAATIASHDYATTGQVYYLVTE